MRKKNPPSRVCICGKEYSTRGKVCRACSSANNRDRKDRLGLCRWCRNPSDLGKKLCLNCARKSKAATDKNKDPRDSRRMFRTYGITLDDKRKMYEQQKGVCPLCENDLPEDFRKCQTDHNHTTGKVRSLLHRRCNIIVGYIESSLYEKALIYTRRFSDAIWEPEVDSSDASVKTTGDGGASTSEDEVCPI